MCPAELASTVTALAVAMAQGRSIDDINVLSAVFTQLGDTLATMAAQQAICEANSSSQNSLP